METWHYDLPADLDQPFIERLRRFPREPDMLSYGVRSACALVLRTWLKAYHRLRIVGRENLPAGRSCVIVANHASHLDALCLLSAVPLRQLHQAFPAAAADYFFVKIPRLALSVLVVNALPFHRDGHMRQSLAVCRELLAKPGNILIIFPEGTRSTTGQIGPFKPGVGLLVAGSDVPVIPCHLSGTHRAMPKGAVFPRPVRIELRIGRPRTYAEYAQDPDSARKISQDLQNAVMELGD
jgi:1-acyl-sn-glycerol-3-phosphate acyltransferase